MSTRVYKYGLLRPAENADLVCDQIWRAHRYRNDLIQIERGRRDAMRAAMSGYDDIRALEVSVRAAADEARALAAAIKEARKAARGRAETADMRARLRTARSTAAAMRRELRGRRRELRDDPALIARSTAINACALALQKSARAHCGVYWGTYLLVEQAQDAARKAPLYDGAEPNDPRFVRWDGEGSVGVQLQGGAPAESIIGDGDTRIQIAPAELGGLASPVRAERRRAARTTLRLRIGSEGRAPIWAEWPMIMHRPLPHGSTVKRAVVSRRMVGRRDVWSVEITVTMPVAWQHEPCGSGAVAIDVGWRLIDGELRVAVARGSDGADHELRIGPELLSALTYHEHLRAIRCRNFDAAKAALLESLPSLNRPQWLTEATSHLHQWRSERRLSRLANTWRERRFGGDTVAYDALEAWRYHDQHLWDWEAHQQPKAVRRRRELYRRWAAKLARQYDVAVVEDFDLRAFATRPALEDDTEDETAPRKQRVLAAVSVLRGAIENAMLARGGSMVYGYCADSTRECWKCGHTEAFDAAANLVRSCPCCGTLCDQDENAARVLLARWRERPGDAKKVLGARAPQTDETTAKGDTRFKRAKRKAAAARAAKATARKARRNAAE